MEEPRLCKIRITATRESERATERDRQAARLYIYTRALVVGSPSSRKFQVALRRGGKCLTGGSAAAAAAATGFRRLLVNLPSHVFNVNEVKKRHSGQNSRERGGFFSPRVPFLFLNRTTFFNSPTPIGFIISKWKTRGGLGGGGGVGGRGGGCGGD